MLLLLCVVAGAEPAHNVAPEATILASGQFSDDYAGRFTANGRVPEAGSRSDVGEVWCLPQEYAQGATLTYTWPEAVTISEIVYYGRTAWLTDENFLALEAYDNGAETPVVAASLQAGHGPQRIPLDAPLRTRSLLLRFPLADTGPNPGASEIRLYTASPDPDELGMFTDSGRTPASLKESPELLRRLQQGDFGFRELIVLQRNELNPSHVYTYHNEDFRTGGGLYRFAIGGEPVLLVDSPDGQLLDVEVSYCGEEMLFSWRRSIHDKYQVYRMDNDGGNLTQLTEGDHYNFNACWLPDGAIAFLSTRESAYAYCWNSPVGVLYRMERDGSRVVRLSANYLNDFTPAVLDDGRIIYSRWEYVDRPAIPIQSLWTMHPDGTNLRVFFGNRVLSPATFMEARSIPGTDKVLCLLTAHNGPCRGAVGILDLRHGVNAQQAIHNLTPEVFIGKVDEGDGNFITGAYENPFPLNDTHFIVSEGGALVVRDYAGTEQATLLSPRDGMGFYNAKPVRAVSPPPLLPSATAAMARAPDPGMSASVYLQDVYAGLEPHIARGEIAAIRVVEEIAKPVEISPALRAFGFQFPVVSAGATYAPKKVWGEVPVNPDGSAAFKVPAGRPLYFMALDEHGRALQRMRSFTHFMPGESQSCMGCHEDRNTAPVLNTMPEAFRKKPRVLDPPEWGRVGFSYAHIVQPVLDRHCVKCHNENMPNGGVDLSGDLTDFFNVSYETLARMNTPAEDASLGGAPQELFQNPYTRWISTYNGSESNILEVTPRYWGSPVSRLADLVMESHPDAAGVKRVELSDAEKRRIFAWIDLNVPYYGTSDSNHRDRQGCRSMKPDNFDTLFDKVVQRRCASCHQSAGVAPDTAPRKWYLRVAAPEKNTFLRAPLAKAAGGLETCGEPVFRSTDDPDYRRLLATFQPIHRLLAENPRLDMVPPTDDAAACCVMKAEQKSDAASPGMQTRHTTKHGEMCRLETSRAFQRK